METKIIQQGSIAPIKEWNSLNCGIQYEFSFTIKTLLKIGYLKEK